MRFGDGVGLRTRHFDWWERGRLKEAIEKEEKIMRKMNDDKERCG